MEGDAEVNSDHGRFQGKYQHHGKCEHEEADCWEKHERPSEHQE